MTTFRATRNRLELLEERQCLTSIGFVSHDIVEDQSPRTMVLADIDGDNDFDIVMSTNANPRLGWRLNAGDGTFGPFEVLVGESVDEIVATDFDLDGDTDIVVITELGRGIAWYENDGELTFKSKQVLVTTDSLSRRLVAADLDNDGDVDLLASTSSPFWNLTWYENSQGVFKGRTVATDEVVSYILGDFDLDGDLDVAYSGSWIENGGNGEFINRHPVVQPPGEGIITGHGDIDGDGDIDFLTNAGWFENIGQQYQFAVIRYTSESTGVRLSTITGDLDGDGDLDLMTLLGFGGGHNLNAITLHENDDGHFVQTREFYFPATEPRFYFKLFDAKDLNGDGKDNILIQFSSGETVWYDGQDERQISNPRNTRIEGNELADMDNDGDLDVLLVTNEGGCLLGEFGCNRRTAWYENASGTTWTEHLIPLSPMIAVGDIDGDGDNDIISLDYTDGNTVWLENDSQTFRQKTTVQIDRRSSGYSVISLADVDGDLDLDVILHADETRWFENLDGTGVFGPAESIGANAGNMVVVDVEGDGDPDVIIGGRRGLVWYKNDGTGSFDRHLIEDIEILDLSAADMDGDGDQDLLVIINETIYEYEYLNDGTFAAKIAIASNAHDRVRAVDLDQDDDMDLVYYDGRERAYLWLENDGNTFGQPHTLASHVVLAETDRRQTLGSINFGDVDQDGDIDVFTGKRWHEQRLIGDVNDDGRFDSSDLVIVFQHAEYEDAFPQNSTFEEGDWNGDGDFNSSDLVFAFEAGNYAAAGPLVLPAAIEFGRDSDDLRRSWPFAP